MRVGTPGFVAQRLTEAREARGLAQTALSELTGIKSQSISHYEQGRQSPSPEALLLLCEKLEVPERYFLHAMPGHAMSGIFFRSLRPQTRAIRVKAERRLSWLKEIAAYLAVHIDLPECAIPDYPVAPDCCDSGMEIERVADACRQAFGVGYGPVTGLVTMAENLGCIISRGICAGEPEGACSHWGSDRPYILLSGDGCSSRIRFDAAHEIGHLVMHRGLGPEAADPEKHRVLEQQADRFARAFLMPARVFGREVWASTVDALLSLRKAWNCPVSAMITRCGEIGAFDADQVRRAAANLARRGWKEAASTEGEVEGETPRLVARCMRLLIESGAKDRHVVMADLCLGARDVEGLAGLAEGYLAGGAGPFPAALRLRGKVVDGR